MESISRGGGSGCGASQGGCRQWWKTLETEKERGKWRTLAEAEAAAVKPGWIEAAVEEFERERESWGAGREGMSTAEVMAKHGRQRQQWQLWRER